MSAPVPGERSALSCACFLVDVGVTEVCHGPFSLVSGLHYRYDLDACDIQEKYPDLFQVNLEVEVEPRDRPSREAPPWESTGMRGLNPKILFSSRDEQQDILSKFGKILVFRMCWWVATSDVSLRNSSRSGSVWGAGTLTQSITHCGPSAGTGAPAVPGGPTGVTGGPGTRVGRVGFESLADSESVALLDTHHFRCDPEAVEASFWASWAP